MRTATCNKCGRVWKRFHGNKYLVVCTCGGIAIIKDDKVKTPLLNKLMSLRRQIQLWTD